MNNEVLPLNQILCCDYFIESTELIKELKLLINGVTLNEEYLIH
jgi:hypothetical protein